MESKLDRQALTDYARTFTEQMAPPLFLRREHVSGDEVMEFCSIRQVNLLVLRALSDRWQQEAARLRSPYFDYEHEAVQRSLREFMNTLSQHIAVRRAEFEPLLTQAVVEALRLALTPLTFFQELIDQRNERFIHADTLKELSRYLIYNKVLVQEVISELQSGYSRQAPPGEAKLYFYKAHSHHSRELTPAQEVLRHFDELVPLPPGGFQEQRPQESFFARLPTVEAGKPTPPAPDARADNGPVEAKPVEVKPVEVRPVEVAPEEVRPVEVRPVEAKSVEIAPAEAAPAEVKPPVATLAPGVGGAADTPVAPPQIRRPHDDDDDGEETSEFSRNTLNARFSRAQATLNDHLKTGRVDALRNAIPLNQKYMFINDLFKGDNMNWNAALQELDESPSYDVALTTLRRWGEKYGWKQDDDKYNALREVVQRRFN